MILVLLIKLLLLFNIFIFEDKLIVFFVFKLNLNKFILCCCRRLVLLLILLEYVYVFGLVRVSLVWVVCVIVLFGFLNIIEIILLFLSVEIG